MLASRLCDLLSYSKERLFQKTETPLTLASFRSLSTSEPGTRVSQMIVSLGSSIK